jgi:hypothetical protein
LALGLIAVATWGNFTAVDGLVSKEAANLAALYRDLDGYPPPLRCRLERALADYTRSIIDQEWPAHRRGDVLDDGARRLEDFENAVMTFEPTHEREKITHAAVVRSLEAAVEQRDLRTQAVTTGLPAALWAVVLVGAAISIAMTYLFWIENRALHAVLVGSLATSIALLIFLTAAMDNPFRGEFSVSADAYQTVLAKVMRPSGCPETPDR